MNSPEKLRPKTADAVLIRTDFENQNEWDAICEALRTPNRIHGGTFDAYVEILDDSNYRDLNKDELIAAVPDDYRLSFFFVVDKAAVSNPEYPILVVDLGETRGRNFRAIPSQIQGIENNLSISNMGFEEFAEAIDSDGIFRGFREN